MSGFTLFKSNRRIVDVERAVLGGGQRSGALRRHVERVDARRVTLRVRVVTLMCRDTHRQLERLVHALQIAGTIEIDMPNADVGSKSGSGDESPARTDHGVVEGGLLRVHRLDHVALQRVHHHYVVRRGRHHDFACGVLYVGIL